MSQFLSRPCGKNGVGPTSPPANDAVTLTISNGKCKLIDVVRKGDLEGVCRLLDSGADVESKFLNNMTALMLATKCGHESIVSKLLDSGADVYVTDGSGRTALDWACMTYPQNRNIVFQLLDAGSDPSNCPSGYYGLNAEITNLLRDVIEGLILPGNICKTVDLISRNNEEISSDLLPTVVDFLVMSTEV